jgi:hypothetical protein
VGYGGWRGDIKYKTNEKTNNNSKSIYSFNGKCEEVDFRQ